MRYILFISSLLFCFTSCYKDVDNSSIVEVITEQPQIDMETGLTGHVDEGTPLPMSDYELVINDETYKVSESHFYLENVKNLHKQGQLIEVIKNSKLVGVAYAYLLENDINSLTIKSLPIAETVSSDGSLEIQAGVSIMVDPSDLETDNGQMVTGELEASRVIIKKDSELSQFGSSAFSKEDELVVLDPVLGFVASYTQNGNSLSLSDEAQVTLQISAYQGKNLYVFHREFEYWVELGTIGTADLKTDQLGYYLIADAEPGVYSEGSVKVEDKAVSYLVGSHDLDERSFPFISSEKGKWAQVLPETRGFETRYYNPCNELIGTNELVTTDESFTTYESEVSDESVFKISAEVVDCDGANFSNPSLAISNDQNVDEVYVFSGSASERNVVVCDNEFAVAGYDISNADKGPQIPWTLDTDDQLKYISNCDLYADGYTYIKIQDSFKVYPHFNHLSIADETRFFTSNSTFEIKIKGNEKDFYSSEEVNIFIDDPSFGEYGYKISCLESENGCGISELRITHINESGNGWIRASFQGVLWMQTIRNPVAGNFPIEGVIVIKQ